MTGAWGGGARRAATVDALCLAAIMMLSALPYLPHLGFYSDDWGFLARLDSAARDGSLFSLLRSDFVGRPVQGLYLAGLFELFGFAPLGYHIVNTAVLAGCACLFYALLIRLRFGRVESFAATLLFVLLPQLSTVRVWYTAFQIPLSLGLMLVSLHWQLSFVRTGRRRWLAAAIAAAALSIGAYEIFAPLIAAFALGLAVVRWRRRPAGGEERSWTAAVSAIAVTALVILALAYKLLFSGRAGPVADPQRYLDGLYQLVRADYDWRVDSSLNVFAAFDAYFVETVRGWWAGVVALVQGQAGLFVTAIAAFIVVLGGWRLAVPDGDRPLAPVRLLLLGIAALVAGHLVFLVNPSIVFAPVGIGNRVHVAAAIGLAMIFVSAFGFSAMAVPPGRRRLVFATAVALVSAAAFARLSTVERYWAEAPALQERVLAAARTDLRALPPNSAVILDGVCPYHGPAIVFDSYWDVGGALTLTLGRPVKGDAVSERMVVTPSGIGTSIYNEPTFYPYGPNLYVYSPSEHRLVRIASRADARRYFSARKPDGCPVGYVGRGVEV